MSLNNQFVAYTFLCTWNVPKSNFRYISGKERMLACLTSKWLLIYRSTSILTLDSSGDSLADSTSGFGCNSGQRFSAWDRDQDSNNKNCAEKYGGGWWFNRCFLSHLNGRYIAGGGTRKAQGIIWFTWKGDRNSLKWVEMKIRPHK